MRIWMRRSLAAVLVMALLMGGTTAFATEPVQTQPPTTEEPTAVAETLPTETQPEPTEPAATEPEPTEPEPTEPEPTEPEPLYVVDTATEMYRICAETASGMSYDQILVYDATNDKLLFSDTREGSKLYPASVTKLYSSWVALQHLDSEELVTVGDAMDLVHPGSSVAYLAKGQQLYVRNLVEGMMLPSGNDAAIVLAAAAGRKIAGNPDISAEEAVHVFVEEMNRKADELGFERSHFVNPDGWHSGSHYTSLNDMVLIAKLALGNSIISRYMRRAKDDVIFPSGHSVSWENTNKLLDEEEGYYRADAIGMKTGYTRQAEQCLMSAFRCSDGRTLVVGVFGYADGNQRYSEVNRIAKACKEQIKAEVKAAKKAKN